MQIFLGEVPGIAQPVEKAGIELIATTNRARNVPQPAYLVPDPG
jgi:hypothetical protein